MEHKKNKSIAIKNSQVRCMKNRDINKNISEIQEDISGSVVTLSNQAYECIALVDSDRRAIRRSRKGIFACPYFSDFFHNKDDTRLE
jgi:hypothetical protein